MNIRLKLMRWSDREVRQWATILSRCRCGEVSTQGQSSGGSCPSLPGVPNLQERARALYDHRRARRGAFGDNAALFQEPAWDILLELFIFGMNGSGLASLSIAYAIEVPITTTLRWVRSLEKRGLVTSKIDSGDARVRRIRLTAKAEQAMTNYLEHL